VAAAVLSELHAEDYNAITGFTQKRGGRGQEFPRVLREGGVDGFAVVIAEWETYQSTLRMIQALSAKAVFAAWTSQPGDRVGWVASDDRAGGRQAAEHVVGLGHRRVAVISATSTRNPAAALRLEGHLEGLKGVGVDVPDEWRRDGGWTREDGRRLMTEILHGSSRRPTAVLCANDWIALGAMEAARQQGIRIPEEISFVGADDCAQAVALSSPQLTTVRVDLEAIGRAAARGLIHWIERGEPGPPRVSVPSTLVVRESVVPPSR
jgi:LacI family transcriptional regulator